MQIQMLVCSKCDKVTIHAEDPVPDMASATVWHCLNCGHERPPREPGSPNALAKLSPIPDGPVYVTWKEVPL